MLRRSESDISTVNLLTVSILSRPISRTRRASPPVVTVAVGCVTTGAAPHLPLRARSRKLYSRAPHSEGVNNGDGGRSHALLVLFHGHPPPGQVLSQVR